MSYLKTIRTFIKVIMCAIIMVLGLAIIKLFIPLSIIPLISPGFPFSPFTIDTIWLVTSSPLDIFNNCAV